MQNDGIFRAGEVSCSWWHFGKFNFRIKCSRRSLFTLLCWFHLPSNFVAVVGSVLVCPLSLRSNSIDVNSRMCLVHYVWSSSSHARISSPWTLVFIALVRFAYSPWRRSFAEACIPSPLIPTSCRAFPQTVYKPVTNRPPHRARHLRNSYKPYKIQTVLQTVYGA